MSVPKCQNCGALLGRSSAEVLCPACVLRGVLETASPAGGGNSVPTAREVLPRSFSPYRLIEEIGRGGMGVVYRAEQPGLGRMVAVKLLLAGAFSSEATLRRFQLEAATAAGLQHPNIVAIHDYGEVDGQPYYAMDLVIGRNLAELCGGRPLPARRAAEIQRLLASAVHYAHERGVVHRDLKPSNVLIDEKGWPRIADFGLAKRLGAPEGATQTGQMIGSPSYAAPEQAAGRPADTGVTNDIYGLGALFYHLLTGRAPFSAATPTETLRLVLDTDPPPPRLLNPALPRDLETICLKCLAKEPARRYATAAEVADDVDRFLNERPICARPPNALYRMRKFTRRHRVGVAAGAMVSGVLSIATIVSTALAVRATRAEHRMERVMQVFKRMLDGMGQTAELGPTQGSRKWLRILDETAKKATGDLRDQPEMEAELKHVFGKIYMASANSSQAETMFRASLALRRASLGSDHPDTVQTLFDLGAVLLGEDRWDEAESLVREALAARQRTLGPDHPETVKTLELLAFGIWWHGDYVRAELLFREALAIRRRTGQIEQFDNGDMSALQGLTQCLLSSGRFAEGEVVARENLAIATKKLGPQDRLVSRANLLLAWALNAQGKYAEALPCCRAAVAIDRATIEPGDPGLSNSIYQLATCLDHIGEPADAPEVERLYRESLALRRSQMASDNSKVSSNMIYRLTSLGTFLGKQGRFGEAAAQFDEAWEVLNKYDSPTCVQLRAETIKDAIELHVRWSQSDPTKAAMVAFWAERMERFQQATKGEPPGPHHTNAIIGLAGTFADWVKTDPSKAERAAFWQGQLQACAKAGAADSGGTHDPPSKTP